MATGFVIGSEKILKLKYSVLIYFALRRENIEQQKFICRVEILAHHQTKRTFMRENFKPLVINGRFCTTDELYV